MHIDILTRGPQNLVVDFINQLAGIYLPWKVAKDGTAGFKKGNYHFRTRVCPIQLWDISFPREYRDIMLNTLLVNKGKSVHGNQFLISMLRKKMGLKEIPDYDMTKHLPVKEATAHIDLMGIGIKEDRIEDGTEMI